MLKKWWPLGLFIVGLSLVLLFQYQKYRVAPVVDVFSLSYTDTAGKAVNLNEYKGKKIIFSFFATWCGECLAELKQLEAAKKTDFEDIIVLVISDEDLETITSFVERKKYPFTFLKLNKRFAEIGVNAIPVNYLINSRGEVTYSKVGAINWKDHSVISFTKESLK